MFFVERDHMIEDFPATRSHPSFGNSVLPRCLHARLLGLQTRRLQKGDHIGVIFRIAIEDGVTIRTSLGKGFTQLLHHPLGCRVSRHIEVQDLPASMLDDEETMQQSERHRWYGEEVERNDHLAMILQEGQPALAGIPAAVDSPQVASHGSLGDDETQFQKFSVNLGCTPSGILFRHLADQGANLLGDLRPATARSRMPAPVEPETSPMPADDGLGFDNLEDIHPAGQQRDRVVQKSRSRAFRGGRGRLRFSTANCCRRARTSSATSARSWKKTRMAERMERTSSGMN